jgi:methyl-accepting chemotaxis protein
MEPPAASGPVPALRPAPGPADGRRQRRMRNYLLNAPLQLRLASYFIGIGIVLSLALGWLLWRAYQETSRVIALSDPDAGDSIALALASEDRSRILIIAVALTGVLLCLLGSAVVVSHRIAGPAFAIGRTCRQVAEGNLARPRPLRPRDLLVELGNDVAGMIDALRAREERERDVALAAASALRDPAAGVEARSAAAEALERVASEKGKRLEP